MVQRQQRRNDGGGDNGGGTSPSYNTNNYIPPSGSVVDFARSQIGVPYEWGGSTPNVGLDCSALRRGAGSRLRVSGLAVPMALSTLPPVGVAAFRGAAR